jgi:PIN domain nuclease of toxin-antitoxin system
MLLDTHALIWLVEDSKALGRRTARRIENARGRDDLAVSAISFWEVAMLAEHGRLALTVPPADWRRRVLGLGIHELPVTGDVATSATVLPGLHADPADRFIVATALAVSAELVTADGRLLRWDGPLRRVDAST